VFQPDIILGVPELASQMNLETNTTFVIPGKSEQQLTVADDNEASLVYVMFTSGSTGTPKGVRIARKGLAAFLNWSRDFYAVTPQDVWGQYSHMGFDLSICDVFTALHGGACLIPFADMSHRLLPARVIQSKGVTIWHSVPTAFKFIREAGELVPSLFGSLRLISFCGEILRPDLVEDIFKAVPNVIIANTYGPTETTVFCSACRFDKASWPKHFQGNISIGTPLEGWHFHLQGSDGDEELVISGDLIGHGYEGAVDQGGYCILNGQPAYRTGDYVKCIDDAYYFIGRRDRQIKIHGNRIELDEIDRALSGPGVLDTATLFQYNQICSFIVIRAPTTMESVRAAAVQRLPAYAVPHRIEILSSLPKNANGKTDFPALAKRIIE
jgi:D-alanine--poly(phosphoribitol) ligase subunit 1